MCLIFRIFEMRFLRIFESRLFMVFKTELYPIHFYGRVRGKCDGRLKNWPGIANERPTQSITELTTHFLWTSGANEGFVIFLLLH